MFTLWIACGLLVSCGGSSEPDSSGTRFSSGSTADGRLHALAAAKASNAWIQIPAVVDPLLQDLAIPVDAPARGMWSGSKPWPLNAIHAVLMPDGRLLTFGTPFNNAATQDGRFYDVWNPSLGFGTNSHVGSTIPDPVNSFCGTSGWQLDGRLLVSGGNGNNGKSSGLFSTTTLGTTNFGSTLAAERWYATMVTLGDGRSLVLGGTVPYASPITSQTPEILENGQWRSLFGASSTPMFGVRQLDNQSEANPWYYPRAWVAPDGSVFGITSNIMFRLAPDDNNRNGSITRVGTFKTVQDTSGATYPNVGFTSSAVMFEPGRILQVGGNGVTDNNGIQASQQASVIDINGAAPVVTETAPMSWRRHWSQATVLPGGQVVVTGGTTVGWDPANAARPVEIWDPRTGAWTVGASNVETRTYHSSGLLLPNGTVFTGGGGAPGAVNNLNAEIYYPPQLFRTVNGAAQLADRPVLQSISTLAGTYGSTLGVALATDTAVSQVTLVALGSVTHSFNNTQRRIPLQFTKNGTELQATLPASANLAPPGYYMVFAMDANGVPSRGTVISLGGLPVPTVPNATGIPTSAVACAAEGGTCTIPTGQRATVYYGAGSAFAMRSGQTGTVACNNDTFGDPVPGTVKACAYVLETAPDTIAPFASPPIASGTAANYAPSAFSGATYSWSFGDGAPATAFASNPATTHVFAAAGVYSVTLTMRSSAGTTSSRSFLQAVAAPATAGKSAASSAVALETRANASARLWVANPDSDTVAVIDTATNARVAEIAVGTSPRSVAVALDGRIWVTNKGAASISIVNPANLAVAATVALPRGSQPHGLAFAPGGSAFVVLEALGQVLKLDSSTGATQATLNVGANPRHVSLSADGATVLVSRFITPPLPGESTAVVNTATAGAEIVAVNAAAMTIGKTIVLSHSDKVDAEAQGSGIPNYLGAAVVSPDGASAWVPSKQDNVKRGTLRNGQGLNFQNTVRAISSRIDLAALAEDLSKRVDHDNSSLGSAAAFHPSGAYLFVALETSRQVAVVDAAGGRELLKIDVGRAPQAVAVSADGTRLYVQNFMDRSVSVLDLSPLVQNGELRVPTLATVASIATEKLTAQVLLGKQLFYDARDPRLARDSYMSCASCHNDAGSDGRVWDFTGFGEGLRRTIALKGRAGMGQGFLHWSANFDEVQDFEGQIRNFAGGTGLMTDAQFNTGTRNAPLGDKKAGVSADLDALAAYLGSLDSFDNSPYRNADGSLSAAAAAGKAVFANAQCASCHSGAGFTISGDASALRNIGTLKPTSGQRLGAALTGIDVPTLRDAWKNNTYLHDGSAPSLVAAVQAHTSSNVAAADLGNLVEYLKQIGREEPAFSGITPPAQPPAGAITCAAENQNCTLPAGTTATVWYGAGTKWIVRTNVSGSIACNNASFTDPIVGTLKSCVYSLNGSTPANVAPTVALTAPAANASVLQGATITIAATAADSDGTVQRVEFYDGATLLGTNTSAPYTYAWNGAAAGAHSLAARAYDNQGAMTTSATVVVTVQALLANGTYRLTAQHSGKVLDVNAASLADGGKVIQWDWTGAANQRWQIVNVGNGEYTLTAQHSGKLLEPSNCGAVDGAATQQWAARGTACQRWRIERLEDGVSYRLTNSASGKVLDVGQVSTASGATVLQWTWTGGANQRWRIDLP